MNNLYVFILHLRSKLIYTDLGNCVALYYGANSMSDTWVDEEYQAIRFSAEIEKKYSNVRYTISDEKGRMNY